MSVFTYIHIYTYIHTYTHTHINAQYHLTFEMLFVINQTKFITVNTPEAIKYCVIIL